MQQPNIYELSPDGSPFADPRSGGGSPGPPPAPPPGPGGGAAFEFFFPPSAGPSPPD